MKYKFIIIAALGVVIFSSCSSRNKIYIPIISREKPVVFETPFGEITHGASEDAVRAVLGNPHDVYSQNESQTWYYHLADDKHLFVYFTAGKVTGVKDKNEISNP
ncbi:MAG: hypothetical protein ABH872_02105 [Candidatus Omnitrophota bacterium]